MIRFDSLAPDFFIENKVNLKDWLINVISLEGKKVGEVIFVFCTDNYLLEVNQKFLQHDYFTDIITFPTSKIPEIISGEIYISVDRVYENAHIMKTLFGIELARVLVHGVMHLIGYNDQTADEISKMRFKEDKYLLLLPEI